MYFAGFMTQHAPGEIISPAPGSASGAPGRFWSRKDPGARPQGCNDLRWHERVSIWLIRCRSRASSAIRRLLRPGAWATTAVVAGYGAAQLAKSENWPRESVWAAGTPWNFLLVGLGVAALIGYGLVTIGYARALRKADQDKELYKICRAVVPLLESQTTILHGKVGVHVWTVRGPRGLRHLERRAQFIPQERRTTSITWRKGKGAMGQCWDTDSPVVADVEALEALASDEAAFCQLPRAVRFGLTWQEFAESKHYRAILAIPLRTGPSGAHRFRGCLSVDVQENGKAAELDALVQSNQFSYVLSICESVLGKRA
jgi:hypothetical protein